MQQSAPTDAQMKNQKFRLQIRRRMIDERMSKIRKLFMVNNQPQKKWDQNVQILSLLQRPATQQNICNLNTYLIKHYKQITPQESRKLIEYVKVNFLSKDPKLMRQRVQLNDMIALFATVIYIQTNTNIRAQIQIPQTVKKMINYAFQAPKQSGSLVLWVLFQLCNKFQSQSIAKIANAQQQLAKRFDLNDINLSFLLYTISEKSPKTFKYQIIQSFSYMQVNNQTHKQVCQNVLYIFSNYMQAHKENDQCEDIINWISCQLFNQYFPADLKQLLYVLLFKTIGKCCHNQDILASLISNAQLINQLVLSNKVNSIRTLNLISSNATKQLLQELIYSYPRFLQAIISSFKLAEPQIVVKSLITITKVISTYPNDRNVYELIQKIGFKTDLLLLSNSKNKQISELAHFILQDYIQQ